jgi:protein involved in polysaccharide export with SLBB domain
MTLANAITTLKGVVAKLYPRLKFDVSLVKPRTFLVHVVGAVKKPGIYKAHATDRVTKVLTAAGGQSRANRTGHGGGSTRKIEITRRGGQKLNADLLLYNRQGDTNNNPFLSDGDVIVVPFESLVITVSGAVQRPGRYELVSTKDLAELVTVAGGLNSAVTSQLPLVVSRRDPNNDTSTQLHIKLPPSKELPSLPLQNDDRVHIPGVTELQRSVMLVGAIAGAMRTDDATSILRMPYEQGDTVRSLIERAGGLDAGADYKNAFINRFDGKDKTVIPIDLEALLINRDLRADRVVHMGDVVNVPFQRRSVTVEGAVIHPGSYQYNPQLRALDYIAIAGGPGKMARDEDEYRLVTPQGKTKTVDKDTFVQPGDTVVLPERHFSRAEVTSIIISAISLAISTASLVVIATRN